MKIISLLLPFFPENICLKNKIWHKIIKFLTLIINIVLILWILNLLFTMDPVFGTVSILLIKIILITGTVIVSTLPSFFYRGLLFTVRLFIKNNELKKVFLPDKIKSSKWVGLLFLIITALILWIIFNSKTSYKISYSPLFSIVDHEYGKRAQFIFVDGSKKLDISNKYVLTGYKEVTAEGSWVGRGEKLVPVVQTVQISCVFETGVCELITVGLSNEGYLNISKDVEKIENWDDKQITTIPNKTTGECVEYFYRIDRQNYTVMSTRRTINSDGLCSGLQKEPIIMDLKDDSDRKEAYFSKN